MELHNMISVTLLAAFTMYFARAVDTDHVLSCPWPYRLSAEDFPYRVDRVDLPYVRNAVFGLWQPYLTAVSSLHLNLKTELMNGCSGTFAPQSHFIPTLVVCVLMGR